MPKFIVAHGSIKVGQNKYVKIGEGIELSAEDAKHLDPDGVTLVSAEKWAAIQAKAKAEKAIAEADKPKPAEKGDAK